LYLQPEDGDRVQQVASTNPLTRGQKIRVERIRRGWTQRELATKAGLLERTVNLAEQDKSPLRDKTIGKLAMALDMDVEELIYR
jgi:transcriptional regulator with XRE-family HTH domain